MSNFELTERDLARGYISEVIKTLNTDETYKFEDLIAEHGKDLEIDVKTEWCYEDFEVIISLKKARLETDDEYETRIEKLRSEKAKEAIKADRRRAAELTKKQRKEEEELKLYLSLKAKFEGSAAK